MASNQQEKYPNPIRIEISEIVIFFTLVLLTDVGEGYVTFEQMFLFIWICYCIINRTLKMYVHSFNKQKCNSISILDVVAQYQGRSASGDLFVYYVMPVFF